jgi:hypothetical protein
VADDGNAPDGAQQSLTRVHWQRLRRMYRSAGWPYLDAIELDLLAAGLLQRREGADTVHLTEAGIEALAQQRKFNQNAYSGHAALIQRMAQQMMLGGRICYGELSLRAHLDCGWKRVRPDLFSIRRTSREDRLAPEVHEIKVRRSDLLSELRATEKRAAYEALSARCYLVLADGIGERVRFPSHGASGSRGMADYVWRGKPPDGTRGSTSAHGWGWREPRRSKATTRASNRVFDVRFRLLQVDRYQPKADPEKLWLDSIVRPDYRPKSADGTLWRKASIVIRSKLICATVDYISINNARGACDFHL